MGSWLVAHTPASAGLVRRRLTSELAICGVAADVIDSAGLIVTELVANAVRHGTPLDGGGVLASWWLRAGVLRVEVSAGGDGSPSDFAARAALPVSAPSEEAESGRGLTIVDALASAWGIGAFGRTTVWAELAQCPLATEPLTVGTPA